ncbi:DUF402 domain-containing protein [[Clostridium] fimetarium]|uniref:DUF402 domain-containing protein n=1 Tax=[Clostridium] fimetarium TaxID=99656 RepID=A0A1I0M0Z4_9FIRM|nr:DUF402 domain-containing protein [[Clostridium] fimetarium]SEV82023.1 hypothetical protein SAMN05421659_10164 [[Clostridium] fimetarium]
MSTLYRKRLIPDECICLNNDDIIVQNNTQIITIWKTLHPKTEFAKGISYYVIDKGWKISKFYSEQDELVYIYCDIIDTFYDENTDSYTFTDLLADVIVENNGDVKVIDLDELATALKSDIISSHMIVTALNRLDALLKIIYSGELQEYINILDQYLILL